MDWPGLRARSWALSPRLLLPLILVVALGLRLYGIDWDGGHGFHPDERSLYMRADCMYRVLTEAPGFAEGDCIRDHPDMESGAPSLSAALDADRSPLNPNWFPLGSILIYLMVAARFILEPFVEFQPLLEVSAYVGRTIMALADVGTVFIVYLLGRRIFDRRVGLLAAALVALAVVHIQHSHFYRPEPLLIFFLAAAFWSMLQLLERRRLRDSALLGLFVGLTLAAKVSVLPLVLPLVLAYGFRLFTTTEGTWTAPSPREQGRVGAQALVAAATAAGVFFITTPYALLDAGQFVGDITWQADNVARTAGKVPFTVQYVGATPFFYELTQTSVWGLGLPLGILSWGGLLFTLSFVGVRLARAARLALRRVPDDLPAPRMELLILAWVVPNVIMLSVFEVKFLRYIFPVIPFLILMGSGTALWMLDQARSLSPGDAMAGLEGRARALASRYGGRVVAAAIVLVVAATAFYALAFETVYSRPHPAVQASKWINENVPKGSTVITDNHWDEGIPDIYSYKVRQVPIYDHDSPAKIGKVVDLLLEGDYLVFYSNRTYGSLARLPERYPLSSRYYQALFSEDLGYELEAAFTSYPKLMGVAFVDDTFSRAGLPEPAILTDDRPGSITLDMGYADENVVNYDHPKVLLFRKTEDLSRVEIFQRLAQAPAGEVAEPALGLMMSDERAEAQREGGTWSEIIRRDSWTNAVPVLAWILVVEIIYLAALPLSTFLFRPLPDRGIILARLLGIVGVAYVAWLLASTGTLGFSRASVLLGILAVASLSATVLAFQWRVFLEFIRKNWRLLAIGEVLFLVAFLAFVALRWANPDLWHPFRGGEKPMDFAYLNAVVRSTWMPPYDPWFAGGYLNYYYWGQFIVATLIKATGIVPSVAYNLAVPLLFSLTVTAAYSLVYNLAAGVGRLRPTAAMASAGAPDQASPVPEEPRAEGPPQRPSPPSTSGGLGWKGWREGVPLGYVAAGLLAAAFVAVIGNLDGIVQLVEGAWKSIFRDVPFPHFDFWRSSRMIPVLDDVTPSALTFWLPDKPFSGADVSHHITEFPFFSFLFADLHAHMIAIPFTLLAASLALNLLVGLGTMGSPGSPGSMGRSWLAAAGVAAAVGVGALWAINAWDYPTYLALGVVLIGVGVFVKRGVPWERLGLFLAVASGVVVLSLLAFLPFHNSYHPYPTGIDVSRWQTPLPHFLGVHGLFLFLVAALLAYLLRVQIKGLAASLTKASLGSLWPASFWDARAAGLAGVRLAGVQWRTYWALLGAGLYGVAVIYLGAAGYWTAALLAVFLALTLVAGKVILSRREEDVPYLAAALAFAALALLIGIAVEFVRVQDDIGRMNTQFKLYLQAWVLFAVAGAFALWYLWHRGVLKLRGMSILGGATIMLAALLVASSGIYTVLGSRDRLADRFQTANSTLDGADYMDGAVRWEEEKPIELVWDQQAIRWLQDNVQGSPVVLEAHNEQYHWSARISIYTGLPTVLGWPWHQIQQRMKYHHAVQDRIDDVTEMYSTPDVERSLDILRRYQVEYVVVGDLERVYYPAPGLEKFDAMARDGLAQVVYENPGVKIYRALWYN